MNADKHDITRDKSMLTGSLAREGYDWWWHSLTAVNRETGQEKAFFFDYFICNPALGGDKPILGQLPENKEKGIKPSYLMVKAGCWGEGKRQLDRFFGWTDVDLHEGTPFWIEADDCYASETAIRGSVSISKEEAEAHPEWMGDYGELKWDLTVDKRIAFNVGYGADDFFQTIKAFEMYWHAEGIKTIYGGHITLDGEIYDVLPDRCYGYADKNWGRSFTSPWVWLSSNDLVSNISGLRLENSVFEIGGGKPKVYHLALDRKLLGVFYFEGTSYEFNFSKFWTGSSTEFKVDETDTEILWHVRQENHEAILETEVRCRKEDMIWINYEAPDGSKRHNRLWNGGNGTGRIKLYRKEGDSTVLLEDAVAGHIGCEYGEYTS